MSEPKSTPSATARPAQSISVSSPFLAVQPASGLFPRERRPSAWQRATDRVGRALNMPRELFTREGKYFIGITIGVGFAAINTGNNLLYLLLGMMLSLIIASGILSEISLRHLRVTRQPPVHIHARRPFLMGIGLKNGKRRLPSFSIEVEDLLAGQPLDKKCYFLKLPPGRLQHTSYRHTFARRGRYRYTALRISTKFPFALFRKMRTVKIESEVIVYPQLVPVRRLGPVLKDLLGEVHIERAGRRGEFAGLREYRDGDDTRDVHWPSTARLGRTVVREFQDESMRRVALYLDNGLPGGAAADELAADGLERAVSLCASLAADYLQRDYAVRLVTRSSELPWMRGKQQLPLLLRALALLPTVDEETPFVAPPTGQPLLITRRGGRRPGFARVVEA